MKHIRISVCIKDADFAMAFLAMAEKQTLRSCRISFVEEAFAENSTILLTDCETMYLETCRQGKPVLLLAEETRSEEVTKIYKYSAAKDILARILYLCGSEALFSGAVTSMKTIGVFSSSGGTGCTGFARYLAQLLQNERAKRVFFLSMDTFEDATFPVKTGAVFGAREYLYYLATGKEVPIESFLVSDAYGLVSFRRGEGKNPLAEATPEILQKVLQKLADSGMFDVLVADVGNSLSEAHLAMMSRMEETVFVSGIHDERYRNFLEESHSLVKEPYFVKTGLKNADMFEEFAPRAAELSQEIAETLMI